MAQVCPLEVPAVLSVLAASCIPAGPDAAGLASLLWCLRLIMCVGIWLKYDRLLPFVSPTLLLQDFKESQERFEGNFLFFSYIVLLGCAKLLSRVGLCLTPWTIALQAPLSMGILQARILVWVAMPSSRRSYPPRDGTHVSCGP